MPQATCHAGWSKRLSPATSTLLPHNCLSSVQLVHQNTARPERPLAQPHILQIIILRYPPMPLAPPAEADKCSSGPAVSYVSSCCAICMSRTTRTEDERQAPPHLATQVSACLSMSQHVSCTCVHVSGAPHVHRVQLSVPATMEFEWHRPKHIECVPTITFVRIPRRRRCSAGQASAHMP